MGSLRSLGGLPNTKSRKISCSYISLLFFPLIIFCFPPPPTFRSLKVASVNVRGLKNNSKRLALFHKLKSTRYDVIYLQETHTTLQERSLYTSEWSGSSFWNSYKSNESGSAVLFGETFRARVNGVFKGMQGQNIIIDIESKENLRLILANIYAPSGCTRQKERKTKQNKTKPKQ